MSKNLTLFPVESFIKKRRVRYKEPTYKKFYSVYQYDREKFRHLLNKKLQGTEGYKNLSQDEILSQCYIKEGGIIKRDSDEVHIFRIQTLHKLYQKIFFFIENPNLMLQYTDGDIIDGFRMWKEEQEAELPNTEMLSIKERVLLHIEAIRKLKADL